jgi:hypothetical protein
LKGSPGKGLWFRRNGYLNVYGYCDVDWASCLDDRRSISGYSVFVGGNLVSWRSKKQPVVSKSIAEAEYRAKSQALSDILWVRNLLLESNRGGEGGGGMVAHILYILYTIQENNREDSRKIPQ